MKWVLVYVLCHAQALAQWDSLPPYTQSLYVSVISTTYYTSPLAGFIAEQAVKDEEFKTTFLVRGGIWYYPDKSFLIVQMGAKYHFKKFDFGGFLMNYQGFLPRPHYDSLSQQVNEGYNSPFSLYATVYPFRNKEISVTSDLSYFTNLRKFGVYVSINYRLLHALK
jgi:hypothetical protein